ncbi:aminotransferase class IV [Magnetospirillum sulfuroxidans]|uniref:Probable branched-chain-amino-acid aminotransferase n=1 Tax=Magnetospirillum sulfuroxidans TaxID=611300 RepID=A0ABS5ICC3_9PROT|nr:aminotransferase class IV [Magnetospirillum sulfuroxidans]MBR9971817.1 aminotransferase class IV [Magnetospirillum sulfuroxidans]
MIVFLDGRLLPQEHATLSPADRGFTLGDGLFETIKISHGHPLRLDAHLRRLRDGAAILRLPLPAGDAWFADAVAAVLHANHLSQAALRLTVSRGPGPRGLLPPAPCAPTVLITAGPPPPPLSPARVVVSQHVRRNAHSPLARCKTLSSLDTVLARMEAQERGADDALLLNTDGIVAETTIANLFMVDSDGLLATPPLADGALPGIRRAELLRSMVAQERSLTLSDLRSAREVFLTNALSVRPLVAIDDHLIGDGHPGRLSTRLLEELTHE